MTQKKANADLAALINARLRGDIFLGLLFEAELDKAKQMPPKKVKK